MKILNIGSGPVTPGKMPGLDIIHADQRDYGEFVQTQDMEHLNYPDDTFDLVICVNALDHTKDARVALREMVRVARRWVYVDCALIQHSTSGGHHYWDAEEDGTFRSEDDHFNIKFYGFTVEFLRNGGERRYDHVVCCYTK